MSNTLAEALEGFSEAIVQYIDALQVTDGAALRIVKNPGLETWQGLQAALDLEIRKAVTRLDALGTVYKAHRDSKVEP